MQSGELIVVGHDKVNIHLGPRTPCNVIVKFVCDDEPVPCNPHHHDDLRYDLHNKHYHHPHDARHDHCSHQDEWILTIQWNVSGVRTIRWVVHY